MKQSKLPQDNLSFSAYDLEDIVYALDVYITENDDKIADRLKHICYKIEAVSVSYTHLTLPTKA